MVASTARHSDKLNIHLPSLPPAIFLRPPMTNSPISSALHSLPSPSASVLVDVKFSTRCLGTTAENGRLSWRGPPAFRFLNDRNVRLSLPPAAVRSSSSSSSEIDLKGDEIAEDYYSILGVAHDATPDEIKKAYYSCMKACHPDLAGQNADTTDFCMFINEVYEVLSDPVQRRVYDEINGYSLASINPFVDFSKPQDYVFVDEFSCIGCKNCAHTAPKTFEIEEEFGRARAVSQCGRLPTVQRAIDTCPVDCIHWVTAAQLALLEDEMRRIERVNVGVMLCGMGQMAADVFSAASRRWEKKQARATEAAKLKMMRDKNKSNGPWWQDLWNQQSSGTDPLNSVDPEVQERAAKAAAAARRWREYSRKGVDRKPIYSLPPSCIAESENECESGVQ